MWMKVDDQMHAHPKTRAIVKTHDSKRRDAAPMGLWVLAGSWAAQNGTDGWVPEDELDRWDDDWATLASRLVKAGYWWPQTRKDEPGYGFNDWLDYNPESEAASRSGSFGNHVRWHQLRGVVDPECEHCPTEPLAHDRPPESGGDRGAIGGDEDKPGETEGKTGSGPPRRGSGDVSAGQPPDIGGRSGGESGSESRSIALPVPDPTRPDPSPVPVASAIAERRDDVDRLCDHLADRIEANGSKRPTITGRWRDAARLMLDRDGRAERDIHAAIDWCQADEFWRSNVLSMPTLRDKYDQLRLQAQRRSGTAKTDTDALFERARARGVTQ